MRSYKSILLLGLFVAFICQPGHSLNRIDKFASHLQADTTETDSTREDDEEGLPIEPARTVSFTTHEGTWISVDVHPGGEKIVFDMMGNLYTIPIEGGQATQLTEGMAWDSHPRYSPNGKYILFISDRSGGANVWYMNVETGDSTQVTEGKDNRYPTAAWSPNGKYIVAAKGGLTNKLWLYHRDGGSGVQLVDEPEDLKMIDPVFGPEGRFIYYSRRMGGWDYNAQLPQYQIGVYDRKTGETSVITSRFGSAFTPTISPDGKWMVYGSRYEDQTGLVIRNLETGEERWLAYPVQRDDQESIATSGVYPAMSFTPDSKALITTYGGKLWRIPINGGEARQIPFTVNLDIKLGPRLDFQYPISDKEEKIATQIRDVVPSPDGSQLAFTVLNRLYVMDLPNGEPRRVTDMDIIEAQPAWSPNGEWIVYATWDTEEGGHLYKVQPDGGEPVRLTEQPAIYGVPAWSYNSDRIVFLKGSAQSFRSGIGPGAYFGSLEEIVWISKDGGQTHFIAKTAGRSNPHFVKYNDLIYLNDDNVLLSMEWDGSVAKKYAKVTGATLNSPFSLRGSTHLRPPEYAKENNEPSEASLITAAPEGNWALAKINNDIFAFVIPRIGNMIEISLANPENAPFPARKLTDIGGQFPSWGADGKKVHWSIGNGHFVYSIPKALAFEDSLQAAKKKEKKENGEKDENKEDESDEKEKEKPEYEPKSHRIKVTYQQDIPDGLLLLKGARLLTMNGKEIIENGAILIEDNRIRAVGEAGTLNVPAGADVMDMSGKTIIPGFVDTHSHMWPVWGIHKNQVWKYWANLAYGVTITRDPQTSTTDVLTYSDMVDAGRMLGPRIYSTGPGIGYWAYDVKSLDEAKRVMKQYSKYYDTQYIKMYVAGNRRQRQWLLMAAREQHILPTTEGALDWRLDMTMLIDGYPGQEHNMPIYPIYKDVVKVTAEAKMAVTPTLLVSYGGPWAENYYYSKFTPYDNQKLQYFTPYAELASKARRRGFWSIKEEYIFPEHAEFIKDLVNAGGLAGIGSHGQLNGLGYHWELWSVQSGGMSNHNALRVATIIGAKALGLDNDIGSLEKGKLADLIILNKNPLEDLHNTLSIEYVMKNGRLYEAATLDEIWPRERPAPERWWGDKEPKQDLPGIEKVEAGE